MDLFRRLFGKSEEELKTMDAEEKTQPLSQPLPAPVVKEGAVVDIDSMETDKLPKTVQKSTQTGNLPSIPDGATRPLAPEKAITSFNQHLLFGQSTDVGMIRSNNQDAAYSFFVTNRSAEERPDFGLFVVADGMGGHHDGEKASAISTRMVASQIINSVYIPILTGMNDMDRTPITEALIAAVQRANLEVLNMVPEGGTTLTVVAVIGDLAHVAHVGDSRAYLITHEGAEQMTRDHSLVQRLIELDQLTPEEAPDHPQTNVLYRALGQSENLEVDTITRRLPANSRVLLCSDGLWGAVNNHELVSITMEYSPQEACDKLVALANTRGGRDNITAIVLKIPK